MIRHFLLILFTAGCLTAICQVQEQLSPTEKKYQSVVTEPLTLYKGFFRLGLHTSYFPFDYYFNDQGKRTLSEGNAVGSIWSYSCFLRYGITDKLELTVSLPFSNERITQNLEFELPFLDSTGLVRYTVTGKGMRDPDLTVGYQFVRGLADQPSLGAFMTVTVPIMEKNPTNIDPDNPYTYTKPQSNGEWAVNTSIHYRKIRFPFSYNFYASYKINFGGTKILDPEDTEPKPFKSGNSLAVTATFNLHLNNWIAWKNLINYDNFSPDEEDGIQGTGSQLLSYIPGLSFQIRQFRLDQAIIIPVAGTNSAASQIYTIVFQYTF